MSSYDKYGNYVNDKGVTFKIHQDKYGKDHIDFYDGPIDGDHSAVHVNIDYENGGSWKSHTHDEGHGNSEGGSGGCFLTSACMMALSKDFNDNCHELQTLRWFRDNCVPKEDIVHYYRIAPQIVSVIDQRPNSVEIYRNIYDKVVKTCVSAIETMNYKLAFETYREAVIELENIYLPKR